MGKGNNGHYIRQLAENENLYSYLQRQALEEVYRLSGKVWTDFNAHDPGVTLVDIANYALTEMDYKLGFGTMDYLTGEDGIFEPERFGLLSTRKGVYHCPCYTGGLSKTVLRPHSGTGKRMGGM